MLRDKAKEEERERAKIHALRGWADEADDEAGCAVPSISSSVMASWELMSATGLTLSACGITTGLNYGKAWVLLR
jgi:hypothetical protein